MKHIADELDEIIGKLKIDFTKKLNKNLSRIYDRQKQGEQLPAVESFHPVHVFMNLIANGMRHHFQLNMEKFEQTISGQQAWFVNSFHLEKESQLMKHLDAESWIQVKVTAKE